MAEYKKPPKDRRLLATFGILGAGVAMMGLSIPICIVDGSLTVALCAIGATALSTGAVWLFGKPEEIDKTQSKKIAELESTLTELKERLENVEVINRFETKLAEEEIVNVTKSMGPVSE